MTEKYTHDCGCVITTYGDGSAPPYVDYCESHEEDEPEPAQVAHDVEPSATAAELMCDLENGDDSVLVAKIQNLSQRDFIAALRAVRALDGALSAYAQSWQGAECWGQGVDFPA